MSYDIDVVITRTIHSDNYTSNISKMYYIAWDKAKTHLDIPDYYVDDDWKIAIQQEQPYGNVCLKALIDQLKSNPEYYKGMNPENGWGSYEGAIKFLEDAYNALMSCSEARLIISW